MSVNPYRLQAASNLEHAAALLKDTEGMRTRDAAMAKVAQAQVGVLIVIAQALLDIGITLQNMAAKEGK